MKCDFIEIGTKTGGLCIKYGIDMEQFRERWEHFLGPKNTGLKTVQRPTGCSVFFHGNFTVAVIGKFEGSKMVRRIVVDCVRNKMRPSVHIRRLWMNQNEASVFMKTSFDFHEHISTKFVEALHKIQDSDVEAIADKFRSSDSPGVQVNAEETLCAITRLAPPGLATKICNPSFIQRLLQHAMEDSR